MLFTIEQGNSSTMVYKDYTFSKDLNSVSVDFSNINPVKSGYEVMSIDESDIVGDFFLLSGVWWSNSSVYPNGDSGVSLDVTELDINYKDSVDLTKYSGKVVTHMSLGEIFDGSIPSRLNNTGVFYLVTDKNNNLVTINEGNLTEILSNEKADDYINQVVKNGKQLGKIQTEETVYSYHCQSFGNQKIIILINDNLMTQSSKNLLWISIGAALLVWFIFIFMIYKISGYVIKPVQKSMEQQKQFISNASHELKTPITVISATIDLIGKQSGENRWTNSIREQAQKMKTLVSELLELSRLLEVHTAKNAFKETDLSTTVSNAVLYFECLAFEQEKQLNQEIEEGLTLTTDEIKMNQLVSILVDNALKYSDEKSAITVKLYKEKDHIILSCENECKDFDAEDVSRLFERFYRSDNDHSQEQDGFGLGLSIAQAIVELHNGKIQAEYQTPNIIFKITLPIK